MSEERTKKVVVAPDWVAALYAEQTFNDFYTGSIVYEEEGVENRRGYISARLTEEGWKNLENIVKNNDHEKYIEYHDKVPSDWRYPNLL